jgi:hypothetical protein
MSTDLAELSVAGSAGLVAINKNFPGKESATGKARALLGVLKLFSAIDWQWAHMPMWASGMVHEPCE